ncbi:MAG TPA: cytochrome c [Thermoanaerobaculia bacterium]|nr:cytochrome c [Thermoanaerobaculia bacterium]
MSRGSALIALLAVLVSAGCYQKMGQQPRYDPLEPSDFFADGMSARPRLQGTVARGELAADPYFESGKIGDQFGDGFPFPVTPAVMDRGQDRYDIYCAQCHGRLGDGNGMIATRGFSRPRSFHTETLLTARTGHLFDVMSNGFGAMPPYRTMIPARDRWAIAAYVRALQLSQNATIADVPPEARGQLDGAPAPATPPAGGGH